MNGLYAILLIVVVVSSTFVHGATLHGPQSDCPEICTFDYRPVCGYDGTCYRVYGNECTFKSDRCKNNQSLKSVDMEQCDEALAKSNPKVVACSEE